MNPKFFDVKKEKQDAIINACLKVFAENGYKKASTDVIVKTAGISKGLLFHYFESKKGAYEFIYDYSVKYMMLELTQSVKKGERDFFEIQRTIEGVKTRVMRNYPYMQQFLDSIRFEEHPDALAAIGDDRDVLRDTYNSIYRQADMTRFDDFVDVNRVINMISWMSEGFIRDRFREEEEPDLDEMNEEFSRYLIMLRDHLYRAGIRRTSFIKPLESTSGNRIIMENMREKTAVQEKAKERESRPSSLSQLAKQLNKPVQKPAKPASELSFEERLARKDTSVFGVPVPPKEEKPVEAKEEEKKEAEKEEKKVSEEKQEAAETENTKAAVQTEEKEALETQEAVKTENDVTEEVDQVETAEAKETEDLEALGEAVTEATSAAINEEETEKKSAEAIEQGIAADAQTQVKEDADSDMIDLSALYSKRLEEAVEELGVSITDTMKESEGQQAEIVTEPDAPQLYGYQDIQNMEEPFAGDYYGTPEYPNGAYMNGQYFMPDGQYPDMYEDDSAAYAELYNAVNNYDVNGTTQEMPINEVLAYRNAFTNEYMKEELGKTDASQDETENVGKKEKKPKKKSFFSGLFGKRNEEPEEEAENEETGADQAVAQEQPVLITMTEPVPMEEQYIAMGQDLNAMGPAPVLPEYDPEAVMQMGNYEAPNYYEIKY